MVTGADAWMLISPLISKYIPVDGCDDLINAYVLTHKALKDYDLNQNTEDEYK